MFPLVEVNRAIGRRRLDTGLFPPAESPGIREVWTYWKRVDAFGSTFPAQAMWALAKLSTNQFRSMIFSFQTDKGIGFRSRKWRLKQASTLR